MTGGGDRALHDALIRLLADAPFRAAVRASVGGPVDGIAAAHLSALRSTEAGRTERFARFLARQFYVERVVHFYKYSRAMARWTGRDPATPLRNSRFEPVLTTAVLGSRQSAEQVAALVEGHLAGADGAPPPPYAADLARYESAQLIAEAGPRVWRSEEMPRAITPATVASRNPAAIVRRFAWDLPAVLPRLLALDADQSDAAPPAAPERETRLMFVRSARGRVTVMRWSDALERLVAVLDGEREVSAAAAAAGLPPGDTVEIAAALAEAGVIHVA